LGGVQAWLGRADAEVDADKVKTAADALAVELLDDEMARVRTGMYRRSKP
jgi:hypothetical protein